MKKRNVLLLVLAMALILSLSCAQATGLKPYDPGKIESVDVSAPDDISVDLGGYESKDLQGVDVSAPDDISVDLGSYESKDLQGVDVSAPDDISVDLGGYETKDLQGVDVSAPDDISVDLGGYETKDLQGVDVSAPDDISVDLGEYETKELQGVDVSAPEDISVNLGEYETHEIEDIEVMPPEQIKVVLADYNVPDITDIAPAPLQALYVNLVEYMGEVDRQKLSGLSPIEAADIVQKYSDLIDDLNSAFALAGIRASIDPVTGRIPINAALLYATDEYKVTDEGKRILREVFRVYCSVLSQEKYRDFVSGVLIVGHTDTDGSYDYNVTLSMNRANAVKDFCLSDECGVEDVDWLASRLVAEGHSYDELIYNADGTENKAASRRVELGFTIAI